MNRPPTRSARCATPATRPSSSIEPRVVREIELVPLVAELGLGPVGVAVDGDVRRLEHGEHLVEPLWCGPCHLHERHARRLLRLGAVRATVRRPIPYRGRWTPPRIRRSRRTTGPTSRASTRTGSRPERPSFETHVPTWDEWDARHRREPRFVAEVDDAVVGWLAIMSTSSRHCYRGVVEHSVYVEPRRPAAAGSGARCSTGSSTTRPARDLDDPDDDHRRERARASRSTPPPAFARSAGASASPSGTGAGRTPCSSSCGCREPSVGVRHVSASSRPLRTGPDRTRGAWLGTREPAAGLGTRPVERPAHIQPVSS